MNETGEIMAGRRNFLKTLGGSIVCAGSAPIDTNAMTIEPYPACLVYDTRLSGSPPAMFRQFNPSACYAFTGDVTALWRDTLRGIWTEQTCATVGLTRYAERFVLVSLAREHNYTISDIASKGEAYCWRLAPRNARRR